MKNSYKCNFSVMGEWQKHHQKHHQRDGSFDGVCCKCVECANVGTDFFVAYFCSFFFLIMFLIMFF